MLNKLSYRSRGKKGFTLIEVVVALGILTIALASAITLVINVVNLAMMAKEKTEATAMVQKGLSDAVATCMSCDKTTLLGSPYVLTASPSPFNVSDAGIYESGGHAATQYTSTSGGMTNSIIFDQGFTSFNSSPVGGTIDPANFTKIISTVTISLRGINYSTRAVQYVRRAQ